VQVVLVPELDVRDLKASLRFYTRVLGFQVAFERPAERFAYLECCTAELMIEEATGPGRRFRTAPLQAPFGRGVNFQLHVAAVDDVMSRAIEECAEIVVPMEERWYHVNVERPVGRWQSGGATEVGNRQFVLADPDGYLWRPFTDLGARRNGADA
jgi:catechol 2,3-dioxygenase-like lactoylglutathione lyase family enzyme